MREEKTGPGSTQVTIREHITIREHVTIRAQPPSVRTLPVLANSPWSCFPFLLRISVNFSHSVNSWLRLARVVICPVG